MGDFAHQPLPARNSLGTVGLWCLLHGEAFLEAGMHHLECQFDFDAVRRQLQDCGSEFTPQTACLARVWRLHRLLRRQQ